MFNEGKLLILDGAMGTMLQRSGMKPGEMSEMLNFTRPEVVEGIQRAYLDAGSEVIYANTFGANRRKLAGTGKTPAESGGVQHTPVTIKSSPHTYTWYIQDYVGRNAASIGYTSLGGDRLERYGAGVLKFIFVTEDGTYLDYENENMLKQFVVAEQSLKPNTEMKLTFQKDSKGKEYGY